MHTIFKDFTFAAAHAIRGHTRGCENLHGHNYRVRVHLAAERLDALGMVLDFADLRVDRNLARAQRRSGLRFTIDTAFASVIRACAEIPRRDQDGTWITPEMVDAYVRLHEHGRAHSVEAWRGDELVGGLYGVDPGGVFCGESMFHSEPDTSRLALLYLIDHLRARGLDWVDVQVMTPHMARLGAHVIPRNEFLQRLRASLRRGRSLPTGWNSPSWRTRSSLA